MADYDVFRPLNWPMAAGCRTGMSLKCRGLWDPTFNFSQLQAFIALDLSWGACLVTLAPTCLQSHRARPQEPGAT